MLLEPALVLRAYSVVENHVKLAVRKGGNNAVHEAEEFDAPTLLGM